MRINLIACSCRFLLHSAGMVSPKYRNLTLFNVLRYVFPIFVSQTSRKPLFTIQFRPIFPKSIVTLSNSSISDTSFIKKYRKQILSCPITIFFDPSATKKSKNVKIVNARPAPSLFLERDVRRDLRVLVLRAGQVGHGPCLPGGGAVRVINEIQHHAERRRVV